MINMEELLINVNNRVSGNLMRSQTSELGKYYFNYESIDASPIAIGMPVKGGGEGYYWNKGLHPIFDMNLPEGALKQALVTKFSKAISNFDDFELLSIVGSQQLGRVNVDSGGSYCKGLSFSDLKHYSGTESLLSYLVDNYAAQSGVSGVQPKFLARNIDQQAEMATEHFSHKNATHIIKGWSADYPELALNEFLCLSVAKKVGIETPGVELSDDGQFLFVSRFDIDSENNAFLGFEDFGSVMGFQSHQKYDGSYEKCANLIKKYIQDEDTRNALTDFFKSLVLSVGLQNGDAHLKNFGLLYSDPSDLNTFQLAPCFDVVSTTAYIKDDSMALLLGGSKRWPDRKRLVDFAGLHCDLSMAKAHLIIDQVADAIVDSKAKLDEYRGQRNEADKLLDSLGNAWDSGLPHFKPR